MNTKVARPDIKLLPYRRGVGMFVINQEKKVFIGKRIDSKNNSWQMPQGGIDGEETIVEAVLREIKEESGITSVEVVAETMHWYYYDLPASLVPRFWHGQFRGQKQKWVLLRFIGLDDEINLQNEHPEFYKWRWAEIHELPKLVIPFKRKLYQSVIEEFEPIIAKLDEK